LIGAVLVAVGVAMMLAHRRAWARQRVDPGLNDQDRRRMAARFRRRMQTSGMLAIIGVMVGVGDAQVWKLGPIVATVYWIAVLMAGMWLLLLGLGDLAAVRVDSRMTREELQRIGDKRRELESQVEQLRRTGDNGRSQRDRTGGSTEQERG
jgi:hypothetical protein